MTVLATGALVSQHDMYAEGQIQKDKNNYLAEASWREEDEFGAAIEDLSIRVIESKDGIDIFVSKLLLADEFLFLSGHLFTTDTEIFDITTQLDTATLSHVAIDICDPFLGQQDEEGNCLETVETLEFENIEWHAIDDSLIRRDESRERFGSDMVIARSDSTIRIAEAEGELNGESLGTTSLASLEKSSQIVIEKSNLGEPAGVGPIIPRDVAGEAVRATWDTTLDGAPAIVEIQAGQESNGTTSVELQIDLDGTIYRGDVQLDLDLGIDRPFQRASASLPETEIVVFCQSFDCPAGTERTYNLEAEWEAASGPILAIYFESTLKAKGEKASVFSLALFFIPASATGTINDTTLEETDEADIIITTINFLE